MTPRPTPDDLPVVAHGRGGVEFDLPDRAEGWAFFIDVDGTLIDIAPTPDGVVVPADLPGTLTSAAEAAGGALALVSGRTVATLDALLAPAHLAAAGVHGAQLRRPGGTVEEMPVPPELTAARPMLLALIRSWPGAMLEDKDRAVALHFRGNPAAGPTIEAAARDVAARSHGALSAQPGKMVIELKPAGAGKGAALRRLMERPPFAGRRPLAIGDDLTDEAMFEAANAMDGVAIRVAAEDDRPTAAAFRLADPAMVRTYFTRLARRWIRER